MKTKTTPIALAFFITALSFNISLVVEMEQSKQIKIIGGLYDLVTGILTFYESSSIGIALFKMLYVFPVACALKFGAMSPNRKLIVLNFCVN